ncbi:MAG TPA: FAD-binding oxidoreductase [Solirubrobacteraceae bacterium]|nr:FAD-binding oxidoreductase [Solirubrobacteraceae bacterium]
MDTTHTFPLPFDEPTVPVEDVAATAAMAATPALIWPDSDEYDTARQAWNLHADQRPACISVARTVADVQAAIAHAREAGLTVAPQGTGHLGQALPSLEGTLLLKTALHDGEIEVDSVRRTARIKAGARWGDVVEAVTPHGLAVMHGSSPSVGVIGYLLGGGLSFYGRKHGLAANHIRALEVVTPDGVHRHVDAEHNRDLFYALRGGGGGYAVVTAVEIGLLPYREVTGGALFFAATDAARVMRAWLAWTAQASDDITTTFRVLNLPPLPDVPEALRGISSICVDGVAVDPAQAEQLEARLRYAATPILGGFGPMPAAAVARLHGDPEDPVPAIGDGMLLEKLDDWAIDSFLRTSGPGSPLLAAEIRHLGGALAAPPPGAGARGHLEGRFLLFGVGIPGAPAPAAVLDAYLDRYLDAMGPWATGTRFLSFAERTGSLRGCVPDSVLGRLRRIRATADPGGMLVASHLPGD